jgi:hypothetical protein
MLSLETDDESQRAIGQTFRQRLSSDAIGHPNGLTQSPMSNG